MKEYNKGTIINDLCLIVNFLHGKLSKKHTHFIMGYIRDKYYKYNIIIIIITNYISIMKH